MRTPADVLADLLRSDPDLAAQSAGTAVLTTLAALARSAPGGAPVDVIDEARELATFGDQFSAWESPAATDPALRVDGRHTAYGSVVPQRDWPPGTRLHTRSDDLEQVLLDALAAWEADGSVVLSRGPEPAGPAQDRLRDRLDAEGVSLQR